MPMSLTSPLPPLQRGLYLGWPEVRPTVEPKSLLPVRPLLVTVHATAASC